MQDSLTDRGVFKIGNTFILIGFAKKIGIDYFRLKEVNESSIIAYMSERPKHYRNETLPPLEEVHELTREEVRSRAANLENMTNDELRKTINALQENDILKAEWEDFFKSSTNLYFEDDERFYSSVEKKAFAKAREEIQNDPAISDKRRLELNGVLTMLSMGADMGTPIEDLKAIYMKSENPIEQLQTLLADLNNIFGMQDDPKYRIEEFNITFWPVIGKKEERKVARLTLLPAEKHSEK